MDEEAIIQHVARTFPDVDIQRPTDGPGAGDTFFMIPGQKIPFATIVTKDYGDFDNASQLDRPGVFRLNVGVGRDTFRTLFGAEPGTEYDYAALDRLMPHPFYAPQSWLSVLNPSAEMFEQLKPLLAEAYAIAAKRPARQIRD